MRVSFVSGKIDFLFVRIRIDIMAMFFIIKAEVDFVPEVFLVLLN